MVKFLVYGEDGLTLKCLKENLSEILKELDRSNPEECTIYYRPSFGRTRHYGEFDAILITPKNAYLIESKWDESSDISSGLKENQVRRHEILKWFKDRWSGEKGDDWNAFNEKYNADFKKEFPGKYIPKTHARGEPTKLSINLQEILEAIGNRSIHDVLLIFYRDKKPVISQEGFQIIYEQYKPTQGLFIELK